jgi:hypothetical protein
MGVCRIGFEGRVVGHEYFIHTIFSELGSQGPNPGTTQDRADFLTELVCQFSGRAGQLKTDLAQGAVSLFCYNPYTFCHIYFPP